MGDPGALLGGVLVDPWLTEVPVAVIPVVEAPLVEVPVDVVPAWKTPVVEVALCNVPVVKPPAPVPVLELEIWADRSQQLDTKHGE